MSVGVMVGKFMPFHNGHKAMIDFGSNMVDTLYVFVDNLPKDKETISLIDRFNILNETYKNNPNIHIVKIQYETYQDPTESEDFWDFWKNVFLNKNHIPVSKIDYVIGAEQYIKNLAEVLSCEYIMYDNNREQLGISATMIRTSLNHINNYLTKDGLRYLNTYLPYETKKFYQNNLAIVGTESVGKTSIINSIKNTILLCGVVYEYAETYIRENNAIAYNDKTFNMFLKGHIANMKANINDNLVNLIDNSIFVTMAYYEYFNKKEISVPEDLINYEKNKISEYLLFMPIKHYEQAEHRLNLNYEERIVIHNLIIKYLNKYEISFLEIDGNKEERKEKVLKRIMF